jgi:hypothetical protein
LHSMSACRPQTSMTSCLTWRGQRAARSPALSKRFSPMLRPVQSGCIDPPHLQDRYHRAGRGRLQAGPPPSLEIVARVVRTRSYSGLLIDYQAGHRRKTHGLKSSKQIKAAAERAAHRATKGAEGPKPPFAYCSQSETWEMKESLSASRLKEIRTWLESAQPHTQSSPQAPTFQAPVRQRDGSSSRHGTITRCTNPRG